ncbi:hypothetical protein [Glycomyces sp. NPDC047010]|uniref:hypothetical protein n=1 Tax=Glycomyces sp. NPDC047010 TaxID=3155023 RepID=UPI0033D42D55
MRRLKSRAFSRILTAAVLSVLTAVGLAFTASPASAAPYWQEVNTGPTWSCNPTKIHPAKAGVGFQTCIVVNANYDAQAVLVVVNNSSSAIQLSGVIDTSFGADASCYSSTLNPGFRRGCFGPTVHVGSGVTLGATSYLTVNGTTAIN